MLYIIRFIVHIAAMKNSNVALELCDTEKNLAFNKELIEQGGKKQVPCLKITEMVKNLGCMNLEILLTI